MLRLLAAPVLAAGLFVAGCSKPGNTGAQGSATATAGAQSSAPAAAESGPVIAEFGSADPAAWVNGAPMTLASARGSVVLIETWDRF